MQNEKVDRRVKRTRQFLKDALISLIKEKKFDSVSVTDIVRHSNINRSTFYAHYQDKEELMACIIDELVHGMIQSMYGPSVINPAIAFQQELPATITEELFTYVEIHAVYFQSIMNSHHDPQLIQRLSDSFYKTFLNEIEQHYSGEQHPSVNKGFFISYFTSAIIGFIYHWLINTNMKYSPRYTAKELAKLIHLEPCYFPQMNSGMN